MGNFAKFYNQNRYIVWLVILIIIAIIVLIHILNSFITKEHGATENIKNENTIAQTNSTSDKDYSVITENKVNSEVSRIIDEFIYYCNNQQVENAYALLSNECKEVLYPTIKTFTENYYNKLFTNKKTYLYQAWISSNGKYTYKVDFIENMLATGTASDTSIIDYYTISKENDIYKLNINKFIGITNINKTTSKNNVTINIIRKRIYKDYETYEIEVKNTSNVSVMLDGMQRSETIYLEDNEGQKYYWNNYEVLEEDVSIRKSQSKKINIKINKEYKPKDEITKIVFSNIVMNNGNVFKTEVNW